MITTQKYRYWRFKVEGIECGQYYCKTVAEAVKLVRATWKTQKIIPNGWIKSHIPE